MQQTPIAIVEAEKRRNSQAEEEIVKPTGPPPPPPPPLPTTVPPKPLGTAPPPKPTSREPSRESSNKTTEETVRNEASISVNNNQVVTTNDNIADLSNDVSSNNVKKEVVSTGGPNAEKEDATRLGPYGPENMASPEWISPVVRARVEVPKELISRLLTDKEEPLGQYDFYFSGDKSRTYSTNPKQKSFFGLIINFFVELFYAIKLVFFDMISFTGLLHYRRGKMIVTSKGRIIFWEILTSQRKHLDGRIYWDINHSTNICTLQDLRQMTMRYSSPLLGNKYKTGVELCFHSFDHSRNLSSKYLRTVEHSGFIDAMKSVQAGGLNSSRSTTVSEPSFVICIISDENDLITGVDKKDTYSKGVQTIEAVMKLNESLIKVFGEAAERHYNWNPDCFVPASATMTDRESAFLGTSTPGIKDYHDDVGNFTLVHKNESNLVTFPKKWFPLAKNENIISVSGRTPHFTYWDYFMTIITFGIYYCFHTKTYSVLVLTTTRIAEIDLKQSKGEVPENLKNLTINIKSLFPGRIDGGYMKSGGKRIESSIQSLGGQIVVQLPLSMIGFAQKMHSTVSRTSPLDTSIPDSLPPKFANSKSRNHYTDQDRKYLPLLVNEKMLARFEAGEKFAPCCSIKQTMRGKFCFRSQDLYLCTFPIGIFRNALICLSCLFTCGETPIPASNNAVLTNHTLFYSSFNVPTGNCCGPSSNGQSKDTFFISWVPVRSIKHVTSTVHSFGAHNDGTCCFCFFCWTKSLPSRYDLSIGTKAGFNYQFSQDIANYNWTKDPTYTKFVCVLGAVQASIMNEKVKEEA